MIGHICKDNKINMLGNQYTSNNNSMCQTVGVRVIESDRVGTFAPPPFRPFNTKKIYTNHAHTNHLTNMLGQLFTFIIFESILLLKKCKTFKRLKSLAIGLKDVNFILLN